MSWPLESVADLGEEEMLAIAMAVSLSEAQQKDHVEQDVASSSAHSLAGSESSASSRVAREQGTEGSSSKISYRDKAVEARRESPSEQTVEPCERRASDVKQEEGRGGRKDFAIYAGRGSDKCHNEEDSITGMHLKEIPACRVVRFRVSSAGCEASNAKTLTSSRGADVKGDDDAASIMHGYDAVALARWLARDQRLPLTWQHVTDQDADSVWGVMWETVTPEELSELERNGELVKDKITGEYRKADAQGKSMRLVDPEETNLDCLDWQFFLSEIERLETQIRGAKNNFLRDRSFGKRGDGHVRVQLLSELEIRLEARRRQFQHITSNFDASEVMADLYHMQEVVNQIQSGAPINDLTNTFQSNQPANRLSAADAEWDGDQEAEEEEYDYEDHSWSREKKNRMWG